MTKGKRTRTTAPGSQNSSKKKQKHRRTNQLSEFTPLLSAPQLRYTALLQTSTGRRKEKTTIVPLTSDVTAEQITLDEQTELETFHHYLNDDDWVTEDLSSTKTTQKGKDRKLKKVLLYARYHSEIEG